MTADRDDALQLAPEIEALQETVARYERYCVRLLAENAELRRERESGDGLRPLKSLLPESVSYERARRAAARGELVASMPAGRWLSSMPAVRAWLSAIGL
jgi:hypothetical protein